MLVTGSVIWISSRSIFTSSENKQFNSVSVSHNILGKRNGLCSFQFSITYPLFYLLHLFSTCSPFFSPIRNFTIAIWELSFSVLSCSFTFFKLYIAKRLILTHFWPMFHLCKNQLPGFYMSETLIENSLILVSKRISMVFNPFHATVLFL